MSPEHAANTQQVPYGNNTSRLGAQRRHTSKHSRRAMGPRTLLPPVMNALKAGPAASCTMTWLLEDNGTLET